MLLLLRARELHEHGNEEDEVDEAEAVQRMEQEQLERNRRWEEIAQARLAGKECVIRNQEMCTHPDWRQVGVRGRIQRMRPEQNTCARCHQQLGRYLLECTECHMRVCVRCRRHRLR